MPRKSTTAIKSDQSQVIVHLDGQLIVVDLLDPTSVAAANATIVKAMLAPNPKHMRHAALRKMAQNILEMRLRAQQAAQQRLNTASWQYLAMLTRRNVEIPASEVVMEKHNALLALLDARSSVNRARNYLFHLLDRQEFYGL